MATTIVNATDRTTHRTLTAGGSADNVFLDEPYPFAEIVNRDGTNPIYCRADGPDAAVAADGTFYVGPGQAVTLGWDSDQHATGSPPVSIIAASAVNYSVHGVTG